MRYKFVFIAVMLMLSFCFAFGVNAAELTPQYLQGKWVVGPTEQTCDTAKAEYVTFRTNGSFEGGRAGKVEASGIWSIDEEGMLELHIVSSPAFFGDIHEELKAFEDQYAYYYIKVVPFNIEGERFESVGVIGEIVKKGVFVRCK